MINRYSVSLFIVFFLIYAYTAAPVLYDGDSGEITTATLTLGVPHPTGFPLYVILGKLFIFLTGFFNNPAYSLNIFSAVLTALTVSIFYLIFKELQMSTAASIVTAVILGFGDTIWSHAGAARVYPLSELLLAILLFIAIKWNFTGKQNFLYIFAFLWGLSFGTHILIALAGVLPVLLCLFHKENFPKHSKEVFITLGLFIAPFIQYLYLIWAYAMAKTPVHWGDLSSIAGFLNYISQRQYSGKIATRSIPEVFDLLAKMAKLFISEYSFIFFIIACIGMVLWYKRNRFIFFSIFSIILGNILFLIFYGNRADEIVLFRYFFPSFLMMSLAIAIGIDYVFEFLKHAPYQQSIIWAVAILILTLVSLPSFISHVEHNNRHENYVVSDFIDNMLKSAEPNAILFMQSDVVSGGLEYAQAMKERPDLVIVDYNVMTLDPYARNLRKFYPEIFDDNFINAKPEDRFNYLVNKMLPVRPVYTTFAPHLLDPRFGVIPLGVAFKIVPNQTRLDLAKFSNLLDQLWNSYSMRGIKGKIYQDVLIQEFIPVYSYDKQIEGVFYLQAGYVGKAKNAFKEALEISPENKEAAAYLQKM